jgi:hypothetical protein
VITGNDHQQADSAPWSAGNQWAKTTKQTSPASDEDLTDLDRADLPPASAAKVASRTAEAFNVANQRARMLRAMVARTGVYLMLRILISLSRVAQVLKLQIACRES